MRQRHRPARLKSRLTLQQTFIAKPALPRWRRQCGAIDGTRYSPRRGRSAERQGGAEKPAPSKESISVAVF
jgi:hypothetical protein